MNLPASSNLVNAEAVVAAPVKPKKVAGTGA